MSRSRYLRLLLALAACGAFFAAFQFNAFGTSPSHLFGFRLVPSERLVLLAMLNAEASRPRRALGLYIAPDTPEPDTYAAFAAGRTQIAETSYLSQFGLQGHFFSWLHQVFKSHHLGFYQGLNSLILATLLAWLAVALAKELGTLTAVTFCATVLLSPWLIAMARNLYWLPWTWFLPAAAVAYWSARADAAAQWGAHRGKMLACVFVAVLLKSLCGYEFLSAVVLAACVPAVYFAIKREVPPAALARTLLAIGAAAAAGFVFAVLLHAAAISDSLAEGLREIGYVVLKRTYHAAATVDAPAAVPPGTTLAAVVVPYLIDSVHAPVLAEIDLPALAVLAGLALLALVIHARRAGLAAPLAVALFLVVLSQASFSFQLLGLLGVALALLYAGERKARALGWAFLASLLAPLSWFVLAMGHSYYHRHVNFALWDLPTFYAGVAAISWLCIGAAERLGRSATAARPAIAERASWQVPAFEARLWLGRRKAACVVVPVINEGARIRRLLERMSAIGTMSIADVLIVDGGSTDGSLAPELLERTAVRGLLVKTGPGKLGAQLRCAYAFALDQGYQEIVTIDGNDKDDPEAIGRFIEALRGGADFVQASRFVPGGIAENTPRLRELAIRRVHAPLLGFFSGFPWTDTTQGFRAYRSALLLDARLAPFRNVFSSYELLAYLSYRAPRLGYRCLELPAARRYPADGAVPTKIRVMDNVALLAVLLRACLGGYDPSVRRQAPDRAAPVGG